MATRGTTTGPKARIRRIGGVVVMLLTLGPAVVVAAPPAQAASAPSAATVAAYEARVIYRMNVVRASNHRVRLAAASCPDYYAENWDAYLARNHVFYHRSMYTILNGCRATVAAENLAMGNSSADAMVTAWMNSPGHRKNILDGRLTRVGVAAVYTHGYWVVTANFTRP